MSAASVTIPLDDELAGVFARMSGLLLSEETVQTSLSLLSALAHETVHGSCGAGISVIQDGHQLSVGSTDDRVREADRLQYGLSEGPCLSATSLRELVVVEDLEHERRWPQWVPAVAPLGLRGVMSAPLVVGDSTVGTIKIYSEEPGAFGVRSDQLLWLFSAQAAVLVANAQSHARATRLSEGMQQAVRARDLVGMAKGVLMARHGVDEGTAFRMLVTESQERHVVVAEAARAMVESTSPRCR